jgi:hypothetical protein
MEKLTPAVCSKRRSDDRLERPVQRIVPKDRRKWPQMGAPTSDRRRRWGDALRAGVIISPGGRPLGPIP